MSVNIFRPSGPQPRIGHRAEDPPIDPDAVERGLALARAKRRARIEHKREAHRARIRFLFLLLGLVLLTLIISLSIWQKIQDVFGL